jgi:Trk K+ transport system NAD-binding subunit
MIAGLIVTATFASSMLILHYALQQSWPAAFNETVGLLVSGDDQLGEGRPAWVHWFAGGMRLVGTALIAGFTAILTNYLVRARLGDAMEIGRIPESGHVVICGLGNLGFRCVGELRQMGRAVVVVDANADNPFTPTLRRMGVPVIRGDATVPETLRQTNAASALAVITTAGSELVNLEIALLVRQLNSTTRAVTRLTNPDFATGLRDAAGIRHAIAAATVAAPAFATALFGDQVLALFTALDEPMAVLQLRIRAPGPASLHGRTIPAAMIDYNFVPVALNDDPPFGVEGIPRDRRLQVEDRLTVIVPLADLERLTRRESPPLIWSVRLDALMPVARPTLIPLVQTLQNCSRAEAELRLDTLPLIVAERLSRGDAEELAARLDRERATVQLVQGEQVPP